MVLILLSTLDFMLILVFAVSREKSLFLECTVKCLV